LLDAASVSGSLIYEPFYGLLEKPFSLSADPKFWFRSAAHAPAFDALLTGIRRREGLIVLTGEIGTGKTTLCRSVLQQLDRRTFSAFVPDPFVSREDLLKTLLVDFGVVTIGDLARGRFTGASRSDLSYLLYDFLDSLAPLQAFAVLVIDEAQNLSLPLLEEIRILSELERREKLLQVVLVGQPELRDSLKLPQMRQIDQRVSVRCDLPSLDRADVGGYVQHRLQVAAAGGTRLEFTPTALDAVYAASGGVPRLINRLCDRALHRTHAARTLQIQAQFVQAAADDLGLPSALPAADGGETVAAAPLHAPSPAPSVTADAAAAPSLWRAFASRTGAEQWPRRRRARSASSLAATAALLVAVPGAVGGARWYARVQALEVELPAVPPRPPAEWATTPPPVPSLADPLALHGDGDQTAPARPQAEGEFAIVVASFTNPARAESLVEELTKAGFHARPVERDWGPPRGRLIQVNVGGYASAIDVQRDLQRIRELPGNYADARIIERQ
jgi:general secretion pathway protein A